jgi:hypothetical protein
MSRFSNRALIGAALTVLLGSFAVVPAVAAPTVAAPTVTWNTSAMTVVNDGHYAYGAVPAAPTCTAVDEVAAALPCSVTGYSTTVGAHTLTAVVADAPAGTLTYTVTATWKLKGFYGSVKEDGFWNIRKGGSTIPLKFVIKDENSVKSKDKADIASFVAAPIPCVGQTVAVGTKTIDFLSVTTKGRTLKSHHGAFHQNWKTAKVKATTVTVPANGKGKGKVKTKKVIVPSCYQVTMTAVDGQSLTALFKLR